MSKKAHRKAKNGFFNSNLKQENAVIVRKANQGQFQESKPLVLKSFSELANASNYQRSSNNNSYNNSYQNNHNNNNYHNNNYQKHNGRSETKPLVNNSFNAAKTTLKIVPKGMSHQEKNNAHYARELSKSVSEKINVAVKKINTVITTAKQKASNNQMKPAAANQHQISSEKIKSATSKTSAIGIIAAVAGITLILTMWIGSEYLGSMKKSVNDIASTSSLKSYSSNSYNELPKMNSFETKKDDTDHSAQRSETKATETKGESPKYALSSSVKTKTINKKAKAKTLKIKSKVKSGKSNKIAKTFGKKGSSAKKFSSKKASKAKKTSRGRK